MSRIPQVFQTLQDNNRTALIPFITAGDPVPEQTVTIMHALVSGGADILELGVPFSDPMADGPVIQKASERALSHHISLTRVLAMVAEFRQQDNNTPVVLMGYMNPIEVMGYDHFIEEAAAAGVDAVLIVDLPPEETANFTPLLREKGIDQVFLIAPTTEGERLRTICDGASGFVYYVSLKGVTGSSQLDTAHVAGKIASIREVTDLPIGVGFGIKDPETAAAVAAISDAVVVGSALVDYLFQHANQPDQLADRATEFLSRLRSAVDMD